MRSMDEGGRRERNVQIQDLRRGYFSVCAPCERLYRFDAVGGRALLRVADMDGTYAWGSFEDFWQTLVGVVYIWAHRILYRLDG